MKKTPSDLEIVIAAAGDCENLRTLAMKRDYDGFNVALKEMQDNIIELLRSYVEAERKYETLKKLVF